MKMEVKGCSNYIFEGNPSLHFEGLNLAPVTRDAHSSWNHVKT